MPPKKSIKVKLQPKDLVLAKMSGWSAWPSFVMPKDLIPPSVLKAKKKTTDYCVIFIPDGDFYWMTEKNLDPLSDVLLAKKLEKIPNKPKQKKGRTLNVNDALLAAKGLTFDNFMKTLNLGNEVNNEENEQDSDFVEEDVEPDEDSKVITSKKGKDGKDENDNIEEEGEILDRQEDGADDDKEDESGMFRVESEVENESGRHTRNHSNKRKGLSSPNGQRKIAKTENGNSDQKVMGENSENSSKESITKVQTEEEKQHQLWLCRIKLQRSLIQRNQPVTPSDPKQYPPPTADELLVSRLILHRLVDFPVSVELLKQTKIHKVLKCILRDEDLEFSDSFKLHEKCEELLSKWQPLIDAIKLEKLAKSKSISNGKNDISKDDSRLSSNPPDESEVLTIESNNNSKNIGNSNNNNDNNDSVSSRINIEQKAEIPSETSVES